MARPEQRSAADLIAPIPAEVLDGVVRVLGVLDEEVLGILSKDVEILLDVILLEILHSRTIAMRQLPGIQCCSRVVFDVLHVSPALEDERAKARFGELLRGPAAADARADDDRIELGHRVAHAF
jgi:hypothetical protein